MSISEEQLSQHPMVIRMMQRMEDLEKRSKEGTSQGGTKQHENRVRGPPEEILQQRPVEDEAVAEVTAKIFDKKVRECSWNGCAPVM